MSYIEKQRLIEQAWRNFNVKSAIAIIIMICIISILGLIMGILVELLAQTLIFHSHSCNGIIGALLFLASIILAIVLGIHNSYKYNAMPKRVAEQNITIVKNRKRIPHWEHQEAYDNRRYEYLANRADNNLEKQSQAQPYKKQYYRLHTKIADAKSLATTKDPRNISVIGSGGLEKIPKKPTFFDYIGPARIKIKPVKKVSYKEMRKE